MMLKRLAIATVTLAILIAVVSAATLATVGRGPAMAASPANPTGQAVSLTQPGGFATGQAGFGLTVRGGRGNGFGFGTILKMAGRGRIVTVTSVNGNTINATLGNTQAVTITVDATTAYTKAGTSASLSAIQAGMQLAVQGTVTAPNTLKATKITIVLPQFSAVVTAVNGSTLSITGADAVPRTINTSSSTTYSRLGQTAVASDIAVGSVIAAEGTVGTDGTMSAMRITVVPARITGKVTAVNGSNLTVTDQWGTARTIVTSSSTTYRTFNGSTTTSTTPAVGANIIAQGTISADGKTLNAAQIMVLPTANSKARGFGRGFFGGKGGFGFGQAGPAGGANGTTGAIGNGPQQFGFGGRAGRGMGRWGAPGTAPWGQPNQTPGQSLAPSNGGTGSV